MDISCESSRVDGSGSTYPLIEEPCFETIGMKLVIARQYFHFGSSHGAQTNGTLEILLVLSRSCLRGCCAC